MTVQMWAWAGFITFVVVALILDLGVFHRKAHVVKMKEALLWSAAWISAALIFCGGIFHFKGSEQGFQFLAGYLIELSLSVDNLFVFLVIFSYFHVPRLYQHKVLFWGIVGALVMRAIFIYLGIELFNRVGWIIYVFGAFLIYTGIKMVTQKEKEIHPEKNPVLKIFRSIIPVTHEYEDGKFFIRKSGRLWATPLFVVILFVEMTDLMFAVDSVPAILAITQDPFIVYTSNVFAIMGLRSFFFALAGLMTLFHLLHYGLAAILVFVGAKMLLHSYLESLHREIPVELALGVVVGILALSIVASIIWPAKKKDILPDPKSGSREFHPPKKHKKKQ